MSDMMVIEDIIKNEDIPQREILSVQEIQKRANKVDLIVTTVPYHAIEQASNIIENYIEKTPCLPQYEKDALMEIANGLLSISKDTDVMVSR